MYLLKGGNGEGMCLCFCACVRAFNFCSMDVSCVRVSVHTPFITQPANDPYEFF